VGPLWKEDGDLVTGDVEKVEVLNDFFCHTTQVAKRKGGDWKNEEPPTVGEDQVRNCLRNLKVPKSTGPDEMHLQVLSILAEKVAKTLSIIFESSWGSGEVPTNWRRGNINPIFKREKRKTQGTIGQSAWSLCLAR